MKKLLNRRQRSRDCPVWPGHQPQVRLGHDRSPPAGRYCPVCRGDLKGSTQHFILEDEMEWMRWSGDMFEVLMQWRRPELWERWRPGESLKAIGRAFGKPSSSIYFQVVPHGGIRPAPRRRSRLALTLSEREEILRGTAGARSMRSIARLLARAGGIRPPEGTLHRLGTS